MNTTKMLHGILTIITLCGILTISACQSLPQIHALYDDTADLGSYSTFGFHPQLIVQGDEYDKLSTRYIKNAILKEMQNKGYRYDENPDLWLNFKAYSKEKIRVTNTPEPYPYYYFRFNYGVWPGYPLNQTRLDQYTEGTLNIDVIDRKDKKLLWEGIAIAKLGNKTMDNIEGKINQAVALIFEKFP